MGSGAAGHMAGRAGVRRPGGGGAVGQRGRDQCGALRRPPLHLHLRGQDDGSVRVEVSDGLPEGPRLRDPGPQAESGRGLRLLEALAEGWGVVPHGDGKGVWFTVRGG